MTVKELKERLENYPDNAPVMVLNTSSNSWEKAQMPHAVDERGHLIVVLEPEHWGAQKP